MRLFVPFAILLVPATLLAQQSPGTNAVGTGPGSPYGLAHASVRSPEVQADGRVTFRLVAPRAAEVQLQGDWPGGRDVAMTKDAAGLWSVTTGPLPAEQWTYTFSVDGVPALDPRNYNVLRDGTRYMSWVMVPGPASAPYVARQVPHGTVSMVWFPSTKLGAARRMFVYTPPGYEGGTERYPVFYLLHGSGGDENAWNEMGSASAILDNLMAQGKVKPMIVVMPNAYWDEQAALDHAFPRTAQPPGVGSGRRDYDGNEQDIVGDLVPFVERHYRALAGREHRALAGLSMGSGITANVGLKRLDVFASIGIMSAGMFGNTTNPAAVPPEGVMLLEKIAPGLVTDAATTNGKLKLFYFSCGVDDTRIGYFTKAVEDLQRRGVKATLRTYPGAHEWRVWRSSLVDMAQLLFR